MFHRESQKEKNSHRKKGCLKDGQTYFSDLNHKKKEKHQNNAEQQQHQIVNTYVIINNADVNRNVQFWESIKIISYMGCHLLGITMFTSAWIHLIKMTGQADVSKSKNVFSFGINSSNKLGVLTLDVKETSHRFPRKVIPDLLTRGCAI